MYNKHRKLLLVPVLALIPLAAHAQEDFFALDDVEEVDVAPVFENYFDLGFGYLDSDSFAFGKYSGLTDDRIEPLLDFRFQLRPQWDGDDTGYWRIEGWRVGQESRRIEMELGQQGTQRLSISYRGMPNYRYDDGMTPFNGIGSTFLGLPANWTAGSSTAQMPALADSLRGQNIDHERRRLDVGYDRQLDQRWSFNVDYRRETKEGTRIVGGLMGNSGGNRRAALLPAPIDFVTDIMDASVQYLADRYQAGFGVHASQFQNERSSITWQNPFGQVGGWVDGAGFPDGLGRTALEPDNSFYQARVFGGYDVTPTTRVSGNVSAGRMEQNDRLLPYTVNPLINVPVGLPRDRLDGRIDTMLVDLRLTTRPLPRLNLTATYRYDDRDNRTARDVWQPVPGDSLDQLPFSAGRINMPYSFTEHRFNFDARYRLAPRTRLIASYTRSQKDRDFQEVGRIDEDTFRIGVQLQPVSMVSLGIDYIRADRDGSRYDGNVPHVASHVPGAVDPDDPLDFENHPLLRKYFLADRTRDQIRVRGDVYPTPLLSFGLEASYSNDDYDDGFFGLNESGVKAYTLDATWSPVTDLNLAAFFTHERFDSEQLGRNFRGGPNKGPDSVDPARDWAVDTDDRIDTAGLNAEWQDVGRRMNLGEHRRLDVGVDFIISRSRSEMDVTSGAALNTSPLPDLFTRLVAYGIYGSYGLTDATSLRLRIEHERYDARDYALDGLAPDAVDVAGRVLGLGVSSPSHTVNWITMSIRHAF
jgi:MtrB/PioB family decaheme-associated outer membrane protein